MNILLKSDRLAKCHLIVCLIVYLFYWITQSEADKRHHEQQLEFLTEPTSVLVAADGGRAVFKCSALPVIADIRWLYNGMPLYESSFDGLRISRHKLIIKLPKNFKISSNLSLLTSESTHSTHLSNLSFKGGVFQCIAQHKSRAIVSQPAKLILAELKPFAVKDNITLVTIAGNTAVIPCNPPHSVPNAVTEFDFNSTIIEKSKDRYRLMPSGDLQIFHARDSDAGFYRCIVHNPFLGERIYAHHYIQLSIIKQSRHHHNNQQHYSNRNSHISPKFIVSPKSHISAVTGSNVTFECSAIGSPTPNITWKKVDGHLPKWRHIQYGGNLMLPNIRRGDEGIYICSASNGSPSTAITANSLLEIQEIPQIVRKGQLDERNVIEGEEVVIECNTKGKPKPIINWLLNGELIKPDVSHKIGILIKGIDGSKLTISMAKTQLHSGIYQCFATNELGSTYATSFVNVLNTSETDSNQNTKDNPINEDDDESDLSINNADDSELTDEDEDLFNRLPTQNRRRKNKNKGIKMVPPTRPEITRLGDDSVMVRWDVPQNDGLPILFFKVQFREMGNKGSDWNTVDEDIAPHIHSYAVNGLKMGSKYRFRIAAVYSNNDNKLGPNSIKFTLYKDPPMKKPVYGPSIIHAEPVSPSAITMKWEYLDIDSVAIEGFFIYYRATISAGDYLKVTAMGVNTRSHIITHLLPDTSYDIKMQCFNVAGTSEFSNIYMVKTLPSAEVVKEKGHKKDQIDNINNISGGIGPVKADDKTLYSVVIITIGAIVLVFVVCIVLCIIRHKQQTPRSTVSSAKMPKEKHPKAGANNHNHMFSHSNHNLFTHHRSNGHISNTLVAAASNGYLSRNNVTDSECSHQINIRVNPFCEIPNGSSLNRTNSINETLKTMSASNHQLSNNNISEIPLSLNTMERRKMKRIDENYPNLNHSNPRLNHHSSSFTRLNGTLERKRRSRTDLLSADKDSGDSTVTKCNGISPNSANNGTLVIMQSSC